MIKYLSVVRKLPRTGYTSRSLFSKLDRSKIRAVTETQGVRRFTLRDWAKILNITDPENSSSVL